MSRYLDPKADVVFKKIFGEHPKLLISFLNAVLPLSPTQMIVSLEYLSGEQIPKIPAFKKTIADVRCRDTSGRIFIVEMQIDWIDSFKQRLLFGTSQAFVKQLQKGEDYHLLRPVYGLGLLANNFDKTSHWYHHFQLVNVEHPAKEVIEHLQLVFIELQKFPVTSREKQRLCILWLRFMREINNKTVRVAPELLSVPEISEAIQLTEESAYNQGELDAYEAYWDMVSTEKTLMSGKFREGLNEGHETGFKEGREVGVREGHEAGVREGHEAGVREGHEAGIREGREAGTKESQLKIAKNLLQQNLPSQFVAQCTGLTQEEIERLRGKVAPFV